MWDYHIQRPEGREIFRVPVDALNVRLPTEGILTQKARIEALREKRLKKEVEDAKREAYEAKTSTHAKLDKDLRLERMANALKGQKRSRHFDEWRNEHIVAWFLEMDLEEYVPAVRSRRPVV